MKKIAILAIVSMLVVPLLVFAEEGGQDVEVTPQIGQGIEVAPMVISAQGDGEATLSATRWPDFYKYVPTGACSGLSNYSNKRKAGGVLAEYYGNQCANGLFCYVTDSVNPGSGVLDSAANGDAPAGNEVVYKYTPEDGTRKIDDVTVPNDYVAIEDTAVINGVKTITGDLSLNVDFSSTGEWADYRDSARILVTWTVRLEGHKVVINPNLDHTPYFAPRCRGTSYLAYPGGEVYTKLFVNGSAIGSSAVMTIPHGGFGSASGVVDPTHTGSVVLTPDMFGGSLFPETLNLEVKAYNDTCMDVKSPDGMRNLIATITPIN